MKHTILQIPRREECDGNGGKYSVRKVFAREMDTDSRVGFGKAFWGSQI